MSHVRFEWGKEMGNVYSVWEYFHFCLMFGTKEWFT